MTLFLGLAALASGFNDDMGMTYKWSPENLYKSVYRKPSRSLTQFYSVDFSKSRIGVKTCVFNKRTIKVCVSCC